MKTEFKMVPVRQWGHRDPCMKYTKEYKNIMKMIGQCIKGGGSVSMSIYVTGRSSGPWVNLKGVVYESMDATLNWEAKTKA